MSDEIEVEWSDEDDEYVATHPGYPSLSWLASSPEEAWAGLASLISEAEQ